MCGIVGVLSHNSDMCESRVVESMVGVIKHRGPNSSGVWVDKSGLVSLGHSRLSIVDLTKAGHQPMLSEGKRFVISFNGEIYNHSEIRLEIDALSMKSKKWIGKSDTETLLGAIEVWGFEKTLIKINGMFAIALWDLQQSKLYIARDRFGEKPLYYGWQGSADKLTFVFGSELKALKIHPSFKAKIDLNSLDNFIRNGYISSINTIYSDIYKLKPGCFITVSLNDLALNQYQYWNAIEIARGLKHESELSPINPLSDIKKSIEDSVSSMMVADVKVGSFLSGGIDSSLITALMKSQSNKSIETFTAGFAEKKYDESGYARNIANILGVSHHNILIDADMALKVIELLPEIYDEPFADSSQIPSYIVSKMASRYVQVALTGDGGDELFGGYTRHAQGAELYGKLLLYPNTFRQIFSKLILGISDSKLDWVSEILKLNVHNFGNKAHKFAIAMNCKSFHEYYEKLISEEYLEEQIVIGAASLREDQIELKGFSYSERMMLMDTISYLPNDILTKVDRASMANSLETRAPFLSHEVYKCAWQLPHNLKVKNGKSKWVLRQLLSEYLPEELIERPKMGFGIPLDEWLRGPLKKWAEKLLNKKNIEAAGLLSASSIQKLWLEHQGGKKNHQKRIWNILMFQLWYERNFP